ncbi:MAG: TldD/PmbA family protein [Armatimonadetes bacterium]|nr:TldD/PmbA family protein [Armatimonadota bacterium]
MSTALMGEERMLDIIDLALSHSKADQTEVALFSGRWALTRFANSTIHQNMAGNSVGIRVRAVFGKRVASAYSNAIDEDGVRTTVDRAIDMALHQDENPDFVSLPGPREGKPNNETDRLEFRSLREGKYSAATAECTAEQRAEMVQSIIDESDRMGATAAGSLSVWAGERAVANSLGIRTYYRTTSARLTTVATGPDGGFGYASAKANDISDIDPRLVGYEAAELAAKSRNPVDLEPGEYECILSPYASADMVSMFVWMGFGALAYQEGRSFVCGKLGEKIVHESVSIWDDGLDPRTIVTPYDTEGVPKQRVDLVKNGVAAGLLYDSYTAHREGKKSTGHAGSLNPIFTPGNATVEEMIAATKRGLLVTRFHYTNVAHLMTASFTGMTRDGTFLIENGRIVGPVKNLRFTQSILDALSNVDMIGRDIKLVDNTLAPALKIAKWRFVSGTEF